MTSFYKLIYSVKTNNMKFENNEIEKRDEAEDMQNLSPRRDFLKTGIVAAAIFFVWAINVKKYIICHRYFFG